MESTGKYWIPVFNTLEKTYNVCLTHPKYVKAIKGKKTDKKDAKWISELFKCDLVRSSFIPPEDIRQLRDLCRYHAKLTYMNSSEKNRCQNCLTMCSFKPDAVFSDVFGKSATRVLDQLLENGNSDFDVARLIDGRCKSSIEDIQAALDGELTLAQAEKLKLIRQHMKSLAKLQAALETLIIQLANKFQPHITLLLTVPGISSPLTAIRILAEIGADMSVFETSKQLCSWAGLTPQNNESAGKKKTTRISRAGAYLKPLLVQIALTNCVVSSGLGVNNDILARLGMNRRDFQFSINTEYLQGAIDCSIEFIDVQHELSILKTKCNSLSLPFFEHSMLALNYMLDVTNNQSKEV
jgi:transposase